MQIAITAWLRPDTPQERTDREVDAVHDALEGFPLWTAVETCERRAERLRVAARLEFPRGGGPESRAFVEAVELLCAETGASTQAEKIGSRLASIRVLLKQARGEA